MLITFRTASVMFCLIGLLWMSGCSNSASTNISTEVSPAPPTENATPSLRRLEGKATVVMVVKGSPIVMEIDGTNAPITAGNFIDLVQRGVYDGLKFHRVVREPSPFVVQGGSPASKDPNATTDQIGAGGFIDPATAQERYIPLEIKPQGQTEPVYSQTLNQPPVLKHTRGAVAMARAMPVDSASSQFYIALADLPMLDGDYAVFGYVTQGMEVVDQIQVGDRIDSVKVTEGSENLK